jgi:hypothetical protein
MATCTTKISAGLDPSCDALDKIGGVNKTIYAGNLDEITFGEPNEAGYIDDIVMTASPAAYLYKFIGKTKKNNATSELQVGENSNTWKQAVIAKLYYYFPEDRAAIEALCNADDLVLIIQTESGLFEVYGWTKGVRCEAATGANGILIQDDTSMAVTISGDEVALPKVLQLGAAIPGEADYLTQNIDALDALTA